jgi:hypothetical protein
MPNPKQTTPNFQLHTPNAQTLDKQHSIAGGAQVFAQVLVENCPAGPELDQALNYLRTTAMWAQWGIAAIAQTQGASR